jgi:phosphoribosyl-dephospho-CoA transferase
MKRKGMTMTDMANYLDDLDCFVDEQKAKIRARSIKHPEDGDFTLDEAIDHMIGEISELFQLTRYQSQALYQLLEGTGLDINECPDVANMAWILSWISKKEKR